MRARAIRQRDRDGRAVAGAKGAIATAPPGAVAIATASVAALAVAGCAALAAASVGALALASLATSAARAAAPAAGDPEAQLLRLINDYRRAKHAPPLSSQPRLRAAAAWYAADMARNDSFSHTHVDSLGRPPEDRFQQFGYPWAVAEVSASGPTTPAAALAYWKASPGHNAILIDPSFHQAGVGIGFDPQAPDRFFWAVSLGTGPGARTSLTILVEPPGHRRRARPGARPARSSAARHPALLSAAQLPELTLSRARTGPRVGAQRAMEPTHRRRSAKTRARAR